VSEGLKRGIVLALSVGIICLLVSPLPELNSLYSSKSLHNVFALVTYSVTGPVWLLHMHGKHPRKMTAFSGDDFLDRICVRLC
jgi:hypothetical protein